MSAQQTEASFVAGIMRRITAIGGTWEKRHGTHYGKAGQPDITGCLAGRRIEIEAKAGDNKPTPMQLQRLKEWSRAGAACAVAWSGAAPRAGRSDLEAANREPGVSIVPLQGYDEVVVFVRTAAMKNEGSI